MPTLSALTINATKLNIQEIYEESISDPNDEAPATLEVLNGGLDSDNISGSIPPWACQPGSFVRAIQIPFERWEFVYAKQLGNVTDSGTNVSENSVVLAALSTRFFLPWDVTGLYVSWQALWRHDASGIQKTDTNVYFDESWEARLSVDGEEVSGSRVVLTPTRWKNQTGALDWSSSLGYAEESRWQWTAGAICIGSNTEPWAGNGVRSKGYHTAMCKIRAKIYDDDKIAKLIVPTGALSIIAIR